jgi:hypothetical protein
MSRFRRGAVAAGAAGLSFVGLSATGAHAAAAASTCSTICVLDIRTGAHSDYDRLVFDLSDGTLPTVTATPSVDGSYSVPSGDTRYLTTKGSSYLFIDLHSAQTVDDAGNPTFTGATTQTVSLPSLKGVQLTSSFEGYVEFGLTLGAHSSYQLSHLTSPNREIVDIYH